MSALISSVALLSALIDESAPPVSADKNRLIVYSVNLCLVADKQGAPVSVCRTRPNFKLRFVVTPLPQYGISTDQ